MKISNLTILTFLFFSIACTTDASKILSYKKSIREDTLYGYFNNDDLQDYMIKHFLSDTIYFEVHLKKQNDFEKYLSSFYTSSIFSEEDFFKNSDLFSDTKGAITIVGFCCGNFKTVENYYYKYNDDVQNWVLIKEYTYSYNQDYTINYEVYFPTQSISINRLKFEQIKIQNESERNIYYNNLLPDLLLKFSDAYKNKINYYYLAEYPKFIIMDMLNIVPVTNENVTLYNDLAYYLQKNPTEDIYAKYILEEVIRKFPKRIVSYINLGDTYWDLKEYDSAKESYEVYVQLMKEAGKENIIPPIVIKRLKE